MPEQLIQDEPEGAKSVMDLTLDKSMPVHNPPPRPDGPEEVFPFRKEGVGGMAEKDFRPLNTIEYPEPVAEPPADEVAEVEEVLTAPKDSSAPESVPSLTSEPPAPPSTPAESESSDDQGSPASAEKDSGQPKEPESGSPTSSLPPMIGEVEPPALTSIQRETTTPSSQAKQS